MKKINNEGFTIIELLAVIIILGVIMVLTIPTLLGNMKKSKENALETVGETIVKYLEKNYSTCKLQKYSSVDYDTTIFNPDDCSLKTEGLSDNLIINSGYSKKDINEIIVNSNGKEFQLQIKPNQSGKFSGVNDLITADIVYKPNKPDISNGLVPVIYDKYQGEWQIVSEDDPNWYNYDEQKWANAVILKNKDKGVGDYIKVDIAKTNTTTEKLDIYAMFVWIPRFSYTIGCTSSTECYGYKIEGAPDVSQSTPGAIDIKFIPQNYKNSLNGDDEPNYIYTNGNRKPDNWYTHPAFTFGNKDLSGIWVGKFETSVNSTSACYSDLTSDNISVQTSCLYDNVSPRILPNVISHTHDDAYNQYKLSQKLKTGYGLGEKTDSHMMKNSEWGAVAYLSQSKYGKYAHNIYTNIGQEVYCNASLGITGRSGALPPGLRYFGYRDWKYDSFTNSLTYGGYEIRSGRFASTTGTVYGIYDMVGGRPERVMGIYTGGNQDLSKNEEKPDAKYFDEYKDETFFEKVTSESIGHAAYETYLWYDDLPLDTGFGQIKGFIIRGGSAYECADPYIGIFGGYIAETSDEPVGTRIVLVNDN